MTAVITGIGVVAPSGRTTGEHWATVCAGESRVGPITLFDPSRYRTRTAGEVKDFDVMGDVDGRLLVQTDRWTWMGFDAAAKALADARLDLSAVDPYDFAVVQASSSGGNHFGQGELQKLWSKPDRRVGVYQSIAWFYAATTGQLSIRHQAKGPSNVLVSESAGGLDCLQHAARLVSRGTPIVLTGGLEAPLSPYALTCQLASGRLSPVDEYRPFDAAASGYVPGEGGAVFVVEDLEHARARGVPVIYAEIAGWGSTHDGTHAGAPSARQYGRAMKLALDRAATRADEVDVVIPDALGIPAYDRAEAEAIKDVFGSVAVTTHKSLTGRMYQGGAALDAVTAVLAMRNNTVPVSTGVSEPADGCELDFVPSTTESAVDNVLIGARGFDGYNSSVVLRRVA
ncbi:ketosynthase chain-length factor [Actinosynnema sp. ALI-1.44]|uniref:beta-ketoacyl synthase N-terminal-like domain-containing protein n=1 Tax=Actinosynnema sp. ALI-1.44 TaxID=1933779 RepID=UPI00097BEE0B|nr:beta-ketoacyl synthase N-terminal-like domain-containing protein [Actinosynnema sp. ALI-1.44]ONI87902.1 ketosynthase chain-length factor [Actinosynnema sp. ALI-1.44]